MTPKWRNRLEDIGVVAAVALFVLLVAGMVNCVMERMGG